MTIHIMMTQSIGMVLGDTHWPHVPSFVPGTFHAFSLSVMRPLLQAEHKAGGVN